ncbi:hypothetical protein LTR17_023748 [Elasticomyces elasticus]|nr:hypothetical protein LTR17_023748 [Elasticomyces elasticus]
MSGIPYQPLDASRREIRVLDLLPGRYKSPIKCRLRTVSIADKENLPYYAALSYTWGNAENRRFVTVSVGGMEYSVSITRNLFMALRGLRSRWRKDTLWVDALGINQSDDEERASQVSFMGEVYSLAARTYVWLGSSIEPESPMHEMHSIHRILLRLVQALPQIRQDVLVIKRDWSLKYEYKFWSVGFRNLHLALTAVFYTLEQALTHTTPSWPDRVWVLQEYVLSFNTWFCWDRMRLRKSFRYGKSDWGMSVMDHRPNIKQFDAFRQQASTKITGSQGDPIVDSILAISAVAVDAQASDPHDKVFALVSMIERESARHILVDYTAPFWVTCARATYASTKYVRTNYWEFVKDWSRLRFLESTTRQTDRPSSFPSWAVDFSQMQSNACYQTFIETTSFHWPGSRDHFDAELSTDLRCLTIQGVRSGTVVTVLPLYKRTDAPAHRNRTESWWFVAEDVAPSDQAELVMELLLSALLAHKASGTCLHTRPDVVSMGVQLKMLEYHLSQNASDVADVGTHRIRRVLETCFLWWKALLALHESADDRCSYKSWLVEKGECPIPMFSLPSGIRLFASDDGYIGFAPHDIEVDDTIVFLRGATWPALLGQIEGRWVFRGLVYLCGVMNGELRGAEGEPSWETEPFVLH